MSGATSLCCCGVWERRENKQTTTLCFTLCQVGEDFCFLKFLLKLTEMFAREAISSLLWWNKNKVNAEKGAGGGKGEERSVCFHSLHMNYKEVSLKSWRRKEPRREGLLCGQLGKAGTRLLVLFCPSSFFFLNHTPLFSQYWESRSDSWPWLQRSVRGPESQQEGNWDQLQQGRRASDLGAEGVEAARLVERW